MEELLTGTHDPIIRTVQVRKYYNRGKANEVLAVDDATIAILRGDIAVLKGPSGSGKTTLLSLIGCMTRPSAGSLLVGGRDISHFPERFLTEIRRKTFGFVFQQFHLIQGMSVLQNIMTPLFPTDIKISLLRERAETILKSLDLAKRRDFPVQGLSGGEQQRTAIARALINDPDIILADEPTAHLDTSLSNEFMKIMSSFRNDGKTIIIASHDPLVTDSSDITLLAEMRDGRVQNIVRR